MTYSWNCVEHGTTTTDNSAPVLTHAKKNTFKEKPVKKNAVWCLYTDGIFDKAIYQLHLTVRCVTVLVFGFM